LITEHTNIAIPFAASTGRCAAPTKRRVNRRFPVIETSLFDA
jgi:hypothetical protein